MQNDAESHLELQSKADVVSETGNVADPEHTDEKAILVDENSSNLTSHGTSTSERLHVNTRYPGDIYGQQNKMIRCCIIHQLVWHCLYGLPQETKPNVWER